MRNKIIFLDIDGVLNKYTIDSDYDLDIENVNNLKYIIKETGAKIVISSDWKYDVLHLGKVWEKFELPMYIDLTEKLLFDKNIDKLDLEGIREKEIKKWLEYYNGNHFHYNKQGLDYVIIDDLDLKLDNFVKTSINKGLTLENAKTAIGILNKTMII